MPNWSVLRFHPVPQNKQIAQSPCEAILTVEDAVTLAAGDDG